MNDEKPLGQKSYGHIAHVPGSRVGTDHMISPGQAVIVCEKKRDKYDHIVVQVKVDGSNVSIANVNGEIIPLGRAGYRASTSPYRQHHLFADWVYGQLDRFSFLQPGERLCGEWMAKAHGTCYNLIHEPFIAFDLMTIPHKRIILSELRERASGGEEILYSRITEVIHPVGMQFSSTTLTGTAANTQATLADLRLAANWDRVWERKNVPLAFIQTNG